MPNPITRKYHMEDEAALVMAQVFHDNLLIDLPDFTAKFPFITPAFVTAFQTNLNIATALPLDTEVLAQLAVLTYDTNAQVLLGAEALASLGLYAKVAYPGADKRQVVFGQSTWVEAKSDQEKMENALEHAHRLVFTAPYDTDLDAKGYTAVQGTMLLTIASALRSNNALQESAKSLRPVTTQDRIIRYNSVWATMAEINLLSKEVYRNNPAKLEQYMLYPNSTENTIIRILVQDKITDLPLENATVRLSNTPLAENTTDATGSVQFSSVNMPDLIDVSISHPVAGNAVYENLAVALGTSNSFEVTVPV